MSFRDTDPLYRVYRPEWIIVFTSIKHGEAGKAEAGEHFSEKYAGKVYDGHVRFTPTSKNAPDAWPYWLELKLPNVLGEFKTEELAAEFVASLGGDEAVIVPKNSKQEQNLTSYSKRKLRKS